MIIDDTKLFTKRPRLGKDYYLEVNCGNFGVFKCYTKGDALEVISKSERNGSGYGIRTVDI